MLDGKKVTCQNLILFLMRLWRTTWGLRLANLNVRYGGNMSEEKKRSETSY